MGRGLAPATSSSFLRHFALKDLSDIEIETNFGGSDFTKSGDTLFVLARDERLRVFQ